MAKISASDISAVTSGLSSSLTNYGNVVAAQGQAQADFGSAAADLIGAQGDRLQRDSYHQAGMFADANLLISGTSTALSLTQADRQLYQANGKTRADIAGAGFSNSGSALDILRMNATDSSVIRQSINSQGFATEMGYDAQARSFRVQENVSDLAAQAAEANSVAATQAAQTAQKAATVSKVGTAVSAIGTIATIGALIFSDRRLKRDITFLRRVANGLRWYRFRYLWSDILYEGVMAQEVEAICPSAVQYSPRGFLMVNYDMLGLRAVQVG